MLKFLQHSRGLRVKMTVVLGDEHDLDLKIKQMRHRHKREKEAFHYIATPNPFGQGHMVIEIQQSSPSSSRASISG